MKLSYLIPLPLLIVWFLGFATIILVAFMKRRAKLKRLAAQNQAVGSVEDLRRIEQLEASNRWVFVRHAAIVLTVFIIGLGPQIPRENHQLTSSAEVFLFIDRTGSMSATDYRGQGLAYGGEQAKGSPQQRFYGVRRDIAQLIDEIGPVQVSIISSEASGIQVLPLTTDVNAARTWIDYTTVESSKESRGSSLNRSFGTLHDALERARNAHPEANRVLFVFSDGEDTADPQQSAKSLSLQWQKLKGYLHGGGVFLYGTKAGATMPADPDNPDDGQYLKDPQTGKPGVSHANPELMKDIARQMGLTYLDRNNGGSLGPFVDKMKSGGKTNILGKTPVTVYRDFILPFVWILVGLTAWEVVVFVRRYQSLRRAHVFQKRRR